MKNIVAKDMKGLPVWLQTDQCVLSSSVSLSRNLAGFKFPHVATSEERKQVADIILKKINADKSYFRGFSNVQFSKFDSTFWKMVERRNFLSLLDEGRDFDSVYYLTTADERFSIIINGDDHLKVKVQLPGNDLFEALNSAERILSKIDLEFCESDCFGYLTSIPAIMGSGIQIDVLVDLSATIISEVTDNWEEQLSNKGVSVCGFWGNPMKNPLQKASNVDNLPYGSMFLLENQNTNRKTAYDSVNGFYEALNYLIDLDEMAITTRDKMAVCDEISRSLGVLKSAYKLSFSEALVGLNFLKLGLSMGIVVGTDYNFVNQLIYDCFPNRIKEVLKKEVEDDDLDILRAAHLRKKITNKISVEVDYEV